MVTKGTFTISGGEKLLIQHGYLHDFRREKVLFVLLATCETVWSILLDLNVSREM